MRTRVRQRLPFPMQGINVVVSRSDQDIRTCVNALNVRTFSTLEGRARGGIRPGLTRYTTNTFSGSGKIQDINYTTTINNTAPATGSLGVRAVKAAAVSNGTIQLFNTTTITAATNTGSAGLNTNSAFILSAEHTGILYYTDGIDYKKWHGANNVAADWTASSGTIPGTPATSTPRLIENWRGRIVLAGLRTDAHNWFMSAVGDPTDWDYAPATQLETQAVTGGTGVVGKIPEVINCLIPYSDDVLLFGCDHSIWQMSGDPAAGGRIDLVSDSIGTAFGRPWCKDDEGNIYFFSSQCEVYMLPPGGAKPVSLTEGSISPLIANTDLNTHLVRMAWNQQENGFHVWISNFTTNTATTHWFYDNRSGAWWKDTYASNLFNPRAVSVFDGDTSGDRVILIGADNGRIHYLNSAVSRDDGNVFEATVTIGPIFAGDPIKASILSEVQTTTDVNGAIIQFETLSGDTAEGAVQTEDGTFVGDESMTAGRSLAHNPRKRGFYHFLKVGTAGVATRWALEEVSVALEVTESDMSRINQ